VGILLNLFDTTLLPLGWVHTLPVWVLLVGIHVQANEPSLVVSLGLEDYAMPIIMDIFFTGNFHYVGKYLMI
jgi:hypothetical protein